MEILNSMCALSGLICLTLGILAVKKQLKSLY